MTYPNSIFDFNDAEERGCAILAVLDFLAFHIGGLRDVLGSLDDSAGLRSLEALSDLASATPPLPRVVGAVILDLETRLAAVPFSAIDRISRERGSPRDMSALVSWYGARLAELRVRLA
ncbi:hypothetical protein SAMN05444722_1861 [Rhodovulum sp. ES.010]|uniref:hypothetical protein n=1 Tax=Rhodovulum sp. ES.010 TaxID=1882821 RepID=UPI00092C8880|nr:hypothetical protein [Rhodovulum sp. ES.010]SIO39478.1 hypothetical protein SAMN05444722_1861 [Rhodovulum sp. ES.010]